MSRARNAFCTVGDLIPAALCDVMTFRFVKSIFVRTESRIKNLILLFRLILLASSSVTS